MTQFNKVNFEAVTVRIGDDKSGHKIVMMMVRAMMVRVMLMRLVLMSVTMVTMVTGRAGR